MNQEVMCPHGRRSIFITQLDGCKAHFLHFVYTVVFQNSIHISSITGCWQDIPKT